MRCQRDVQASPGMFFTFTDIEKSVAAVMVQNPFQFLRVRVQVFTDFTHRYLFQLEFFLLHQQFSDA